jgi:iron complex transport system ATP-binding protein
VSALLECRGLTCAYDDKVVLRDVSLCVDAGESVALLGPNGSGKSTLLKALSKTLRPQAGEVRLSGTRLDQMSHVDAAKRVAFVPQEEPASFPFPVRDVVTMGRLPHSPGLRDTQADYDAATGAMELADCLHLQDRPITELSGGERQRVLLARALAQDAPLMLFDEPTSHLDVGHQLAVAALALRLGREGKAAVSAVHDLNLVPMLATRAILLVDGGIGLDAPAEEVLRSPLLDQVYGVRFSRVELPNGRLALYPE